MTPTSPPHSYGLRENAVWSSLTPYEEVAAIREYLAFYCGKVDHWYEEDEEIFGHPRDPYHRIDLRPSSHSRAGDAWRGACGRQPAGAVPVRDRPADPLLPAA